MKLVSPRERVAARGRGICLIIPWLWPHRTTPYPAGMSCASDKRKLEENVQPIRTGLSKKRKTDKMEEEHLDSEAEAEESRGRGDGWIC